MENEKNILNAKISELNEHNEQLNTIINEKEKIIQEKKDIYNNDNFMKNGNGKFIWNENKYYDGQWVNNKQHGKGLIYYDGKEIEGMFRYGKIIKEK